MGTHHTHHQNLIASYTPHHTPHTTHHTPHTTHHTPHTTPHHTTPHHTRHPKPLCFLSQRFWMSGVVWCGVVWCGVWCVVCGVWCVVCGVWCVMCGVVTNTFIEIIFYLLLLQSRNITRKTVFNL